MAKKSCLFFLFFCISCTSYEQFLHMTEEFEIPSKIYDAEYLETWQAVLKVMQRYNLEINNQETGIIRTYWTDYTDEANFTESLASQNAIKTAHFKLVVNVSKGFRGTREMTKVTVYKRQVIEYDFLQGRQIVNSDGNLEKIILYRLGRVLAINKALQAIEDQKIKESEESL